MFKKARIGFVGSGNMGGALIKGLLEARLFPADQVSAFDIDRARLEELHQRFAIETASSIEQLATRSDIVVLAVKPQVMASVLADLRPHLRHFPLVISIAAGVPLSFLGGALPDGLAIVRVMPNTPALVQQGASALARGSFVTDEQMEQAVKIFQSVGIALEVDEKLLDAVTGLSGSGPAYVLTFIEAFIDSGVLMGLPRPVARQLVLQTVLGTTRMVEESGQHPAQLKDMITSPAGTTIYGLKVLERAAVREAVMGAVEAATERSRQLGQGAEAKSKS